MPVLNEGAITVARVTGMTQATGFWGYRRWRLGADGSVIGGMCLFDAAFDRSASPFVRSLRAHALGHALGYHQVSGRISVMNADARSEPNDSEAEALRRHHVWPGCFALNSTSRLATAKKNPVDQPHIRIPVRASTAPTSRQFSGSTRSP